MEIPEVAGHWLWGSVGAFRAEPWHYAGRVAAEHGGIARFRLLHRRFVGVNHPELYDHVMVKNAAAYGRGVHFRNQHVILGRGMISTEGEEWSRKRARGTPAFNRDALKRMVPTSVGIAARALDRWERADDVSLLAEMQTLTIPVICRSLFSAEMDPAQAAGFCEVIRDASQLIHRKNTAVFPMPLWLPTRANAELLRTQKAMDTFVREKIAQHAARGEGADILGTLLGGRPFDALDEAERQEIVDECKTLLVAGFETTALTLTWTLYLLASHPDVAARWHAECDGIEGTTWEGLERLTYTRQVVQEAMRLYPVVFTQPRECLQDDVLGGYRVRAGDVLLLSIFGMHRDPAHWPDPDRFDPDRFAPDRAWPRRSYMPFGKGKHTCVGNHFSMLEMLVILSMIGRRYTLRRTETGEVGIRCTVALVPDRDIRVAPTRRA
jgi:cytochrome P450